VLILFYCEIELFKFYMNFALLCKMGGWKIVKYIMSHKSYDLQHMVFKKNCDQYFKNSHFFARKMTNFVCF
jgi:hypothetical protein